MNWARVVMLLLAAFVVIGMVATIREALHRYWDRQDRKSKSQGE